MTSLTTPTQIDGFRVLVLVKSMELYLRHGLKSTRAATAVLFAVNAPTTDTNVIARHRGGDG